MHNIGLLTEEVCNNETAKTTAYHNNHPGRNILVSSVFAFSGRIGFKCFFFSGPTQSCHSRRTQAYLEDGGQMPSSPRPLKRFSLLLHLATISNYF